MHLYVVEEFEADRAADAVAELLVLLREVLQQRSCSD